MNTASVTTSKYTCTYWIMHLVHSSQCHVTIINFTAYMCAWELKKIGLVR